MQPAARDYVVLTFSPQPSVADFLRRIVDQAGFASRATSTVDELHDAATAVVPDAIIYEIGFPFTDNWRQLSELRSRAALQRVPFVITTPDAPELYRRVGVPAIELFRKPDDLSAFRETVLSAIHAAA